MLTGLDLYVPVGSFDLLHWRVPMWVLDLCLTCFFYTSPTLHTFRGSVSGQGRQILLGDRILCSRCLPVEGGMDPEGAASLCLQDFTTLPVVLSWLPAHCVRTDVDMPAPLLPLL